MSSYPSALRAPLPALCIDLAINPYQQLLMDS